MEAQSHENLNGKLLIAMPGIGDPRFDRSVVYVCAHSAEGAMGLIINKPAGDLQFSDLLKQLGIAAGDQAIQVPVLIGGPVENSRGFVLHSRDYTATEATLEVSEDFGMTATRDILSDISRGAGPESCLLALGYSGWGPGQLETEIRANGWLICEASSDLVFSLRNDQKWDQALATIGIDPRLLSAKGGMA
jgi:putative transcriptional regulator